MRRRLSGATTEAVKLPGAVDPASYRVGAGDQLQLTLWGGVSRTIPMEVTPEGTVLLPTTGPLHVEGRLLSDVRKDVLATAFHLLGIDPHTTVPDRSNRPMLIAGAGVVRPELLG